MQIDNMTITGGNQQFKGKPLSEYSTDELILEINNRVETKYNPDGIGLSKGKRRSWQGYEKGQLAPEGHRLFLSHIVLCGGQVEVKKEGMMNNGASFAEVVVYYIHPDSKK